MTDPDGPMAEDEAFVCVVHRYVVGDKTYYLLCPDDDPDVEDL